MRFELAHQKGMTVWPADCAMAVTPIELRMWPIFHDVRRQLLEEQKSKQGGTLNHGAKPRKS